MTKTELMKRLEGQKMVVKYLQLLPDNIVMNKTKVNFSCPVHGDFFKTPTQFFRSRGGGCPSCNRGRGRKEIQDRLLEVFKTDAPKKFNNRFTYDYTTFKGHREPMRMICPDHGEFWAEPSRHLHTKEAGGCKQCSGILKGQRKSNSDHSWLNRAAEAHKGKYTYLGISPVEGTPDASKRTITFVCPEHGEMTKGLKDHVLEKKGCWHCGQMVSAEKRTRTTEEVQKEIETIYPRKLSFEKFAYTGARGNFTLHCLEHDLDFETNMDRCHKNPRFYPCPKCSPRSDSAAQRLISESVVALGIPTIYNDRKTLNGKEIDILIPDLNLGIEYNGVYWHSEKWLHKVRDAKWHMLEKQQLAAAKGIELVHFDSTVPLEKIINFIKFKAGKVPKVFARKTTVAETPKAEAEKLLNELHIQGAAKGCVSYGLYQRESLLGVASFSKATSERGNKNVNRWELRRMVFNCHVIGGASKLLKAFTRNHPEVSSIISYSDNRWFTGGVYKALGFTHVKDCPVDYAYTKCDSVWHKARFKHSVMKKKQNFNYNPELSEIENCHVNGYFRIWDCGKKKWEINLNGEQNGES